MRVIGVTGGIASGKSTVTEMLRTSGEVVVCADSLYHALIAPTAGKPSALAQKIVVAFPGVLASDGSIDRGKLGSIVYHDPEARRRLGAITHPAVAQALADALTGYAAQGIERVFYDVPLLYENKIDVLIPEVIVVWVSPDVQLQRLMVRDRLNETEARARINSQMPLDEKRDRATWVIDNSGTIEQTKQQVVGLIISTFFARRATDQL